jgi:hypothetical protein
LVRNTLGEDDSNLLRHLLSRIDHRKERNAERSRLYDGKQLVKSLGVAVNPQFDNLQTVVGWPSTVVDALNERRSIDHIECPQSADLTDILQSVYAFNDLDVELAMGRDDQAIHGITFGVVARHDGNTIVLMTPATRMTCEYERAQRRITSAASRDGRYSGEPNAQATLYLPDVTHRVEVDGGKFRILESFPNPVGVVPVERFVNRPRHDRPWGNSEITPAVISYTNAAVRTLVSMEVAREFFAAPQRYALNIDPDAFTDGQGNEIPAWQTYWGKFIALSGATNEDGETPLAPFLGQLDASSPAPLTEILRALSQMMTAETRMPPSLWGFVTDNPASGDGARMYENGLVLKAKQRNRFDSGPLGRLSKLMLLAEGEKRETVDALKVETIWTDPGTQLPTATADAVSKEIASGALPADSDVALEKFGHSRQEVVRIQQDRRKAAARGVVAGLADIASRNQPVVTNADQPAAAVVPAG